MTTKNIKINVDTKDAVKETDKLAKGFDKTGDEAKQTQAEISTLTGGAGARFKGIITSIKSVALGFRSIGFAIAASGIGLVLLTIAAVTAAFKNSEGGQDKFAKLMHRIGTVTGTVVDLLADFGNFIIDLFSGEGTAMQSLKDFGKAIFDLIGLPIKNAMDTAEALGKALGSLFSGDISQAFEDLKKGVSDVKENFSQAKDVIDSATEAVKAFTLELSEEDKISQRISDNRAKATKLERDLIVERSKAERDIAQFRVDSRDRENKTVQERIAALDSVLAIQVQIADKEVEIAKIRRDATIAENNLAGSKGADLDAEAQLTAAVIQAETNRLNSSRLILQERLSLQKQFTADRLKLNAPVADGLNIEDSLIFDSKKILNEKLKELDIERRVSEEEVSRQRVVLEEKVKDAKVGIAQNTLALVGALANEGTALAKAAAVAQATISGFQGAQNAFTTASASPITTLFPAYPFIQAGLAGAFSAVQIGNILKTPNNGSGQPPSGNTNTGGRSPQAPSFNLVQGTQGNQIANSLNSQAPIQTFVVGTAVTSQQSLDRNSESNGTL
tara:strand:+ start:15997 stop:17676 length:1680 start_codon:yes stop_codon:yes gene_type:complete